MNADAYSLGRARVAIANARLAADRRAAGLAELHLQDAYGWLMRARDSRHAAPPGYEAQKGMHELATRP
jgi:hypothetical protein